jgi:hypothetical protein
MMEQQEATKYIKNLVSKRIPYKENPPYSVTEGFNCLSLVQHIYKLYNISIYEFNDDLKRSREQFIIIKDKPKFLDVPLFYMSIMGTRHVGLMINEFQMVQCSKGTNGVSICHIDRQPWKNLLKYFYRLKNEI